ncbi:MAG: hypothetical protein AB8B78_06150 [Polaribacter sp.]
MFLQILPPDNVATTETILENQLVFVILGLAIGVFAILRIAKYLSKLKISKTVTKPSFTS